MNLAFSLSARKMTALAMSFGSPKKPSIPEALALNLADETDAKMETFKELLETSEKPGWQGYDRMFESHIFATRVEE